MISYTTLDGIKCERLDYGERRDLVLASLAAKPWQTRAELGRGATPMLLARLMARGIVQRRRPDVRRSDAPPVGLIPYEYALAGAP